MAIETQEFSITCSQSQTSVTGGTTYTGSTTITFTKGEIQSLSVSNSKATASFSGSIITIRGTSPIKNGRVTGTVTITYQGLEKIKITKSDGTSSLISIAFPTEPGRYKIKAKMSDGSTIESGTFLRYASNSNRTLKLRFGLSNGTSREVSFTLEPTGWTAPSNNITGVYFSSIGKWKLTGNISNKNNYPIIARLYATAENYTDYGNELAKYTISANNYVLVNQPSIDTDAKNIKYKLEYYSSDDKMLIDSYTYTLNIPAETTTTTTV